MEKYKRIIQIWTLKESYIKYLGTGFSTEMNTFSVDALNSIMMTQNHELLDGIKIKSILIKQNYYVSICSEESEFVIKEVPLEGIIEMAYRKSKKINNYSKCGK